MKGVRFREDVGFEGQCEYCREYWPLAREFWDFAHGFRMCRACIALYRRLQQRKRRLDPAQRERDRLSSEANRLAKKAADPLRFKEYQAGWYARNRDRILREKKERYVAARLAAGKPYTPREENPSSMIAEQMRLEARRSYKTDWQRRKRAA